MTALAVTLPGGSEWIIILLIFVLLFGAKKLPELGGSVGRSIRNFRKGMDEAKDEDEGEATSEGAQADLEAEAKGSASAARDPE